MEEEKDIKSQIIINDEKFTALRLQDNLNSPISQQYQKNKRK